MANPKEQALKKGIEQAVLNAFIPTKKIKYTPKLSPQLQLFARLLHEELIRYETTHVVFTGTIPNVGVLDVTHQFGYIPKTNLVEVLTSSGNADPDGYVTSSEVVLAHITVTTFRVVGTPGRQFRLRLW